jgi:alpha-L-rhamnosidase
VSGFSPAVVDTFSFHIIEVFPSREAFMKPAAVNDLKASWIWIKTDDPARPNTFVYFRRSFQVNTPQESSRLTVSADTTYHLFLNGEFIGSGPVMTEPRWQTYDTFDVTGKVRAGTNVLAAIVHHSGNGPNNPSGNTFYASRGGFLCQLDLDDRTPILSDSTWHVLSASSWKQDVPRIDRMTFSEMFDAQLEPNGWKEDGFDDSHWEPAEVVRLPPLVAEWSWNPHPSAVYPWLKLEPRPIDHFIRRKIESLRLLYFGEVLERAEALRANDTAIRLSLEVPQPSRYTRITGVERLPEPPEDTPVLICPMPDDFGYDNFPGIHDPVLAFDAGKLHNGRLRIDLTAPAGTVLETGYSQILVDGRVIPYLSHRTPLADQFITREGRQVLETFHWRHFQYVQLTFRLMTKPVQIHGIEMIEEVYPARRKGGFRCSDERLNFAWEASIRTVDLCVHDRFMDNPVRERREYAGDLLSLGPALLTGYGDTQRLWKYYQDMQHAFQSYGIVPHTVMGNRHEIYSLHAESPFELILHIWQAYELTGELRLLHEFYPLLLKSLDLMQHYADERGLLGPSPYTLFVDWAFLERRGFPLLTNLLLTESLNVLTLMAEVLGHPEESQAFKTRYQYLAGVIKDLYWNSASGVFCDAIVEGVQSPHVSEHCNFLMMLFGLADDAQCQAISSVLREPDLSMGQVEPSFVWAVEGLFKRGFGCWAAGLLATRYDRFRRQGLGTVAELWNLLGERFTGRWRSRDSRSAAQGSGVIAAYLLSRYILGIMPAKPGFEMVRIAPTLAGLEWAEGCWPSPQGDIHVKWRIDKNAAFSLEYDLPEGIPGIFTPPDEIQERESWLLNGIKVELDEGGNIPLSGTGHISSS